MKQQIQKLLLTAAAFAALPILLLAQPTAHYVPGVEGIKGASLPPPGVYLRDYNVFYFADRYNDGSGNEIASPDVFIYANVPRLVWITDQQVLGGFLGVDALLPLQYASVNNDSTFGAADLFAETTLSWHKEKYDLSVGCGVWAPTGNSSPTDPTSPGLGYWTPMLTAGATWYPDTEKKWAVSLLNRYEFNTEKDDTSITPGQAYTLEWGVSYAVKKTMDIGLVGYCQFQTTTDSNPGSVNPKDQVIAIGPEIATVCPVTGLMVSLRYLREVAAENRLQGNTVTLTLTYRF